MLDVLLPGKNGFEILSELRDSHPQLPVITLTARGTEEDRVEPRGGKRRRKTLKPEPSGFRRPTTALRIPASQNPSRPPCALNKNRGKWRIVC